ncbi:MAG: hypothetical protein ABIW76_02300 [Fibrobacteria bacterium]
MEYEAGASAAEDPEAPESPGFFSWQAVNWRTSGIKKAGNSPDFLMESMLVRYRRIPNVLI